MVTEAPLKVNIRTPLQWMIVGGPGLLVMLSDTDAGNVVTGAQAGAQWGYRLLPLVLLLIPMLYMVQELTVRLGIYTGRGFGELVRERFGVGWAWPATVALAIAAIGTLVTQFTGIVGIGELYGVPRGITLSFATVALLSIVATGSYRRVERVLVVIGMFELAFFFVAWAAHPSLATMGKDVVNLPYRQRPIHVSGSRDHRRSLQPVDDLLPTIRLCRQETFAWQHRGCTLGYCHWRGADAVPDRSHTDCGKQHWLLAGPPRAFTVSVRSVRSCRHFLESVWGAWSSASVCWAPPR